jgi:hypothetical protein
MDPDSTSAGSPYLDCAAAAVYLHYASAASLRHRVGPMGIPHRRLGRRLLFLPAELDAWLKRQADTYHARPTRRRRPATRRRKSH